MMNEDIKKTFGLILNNIEEEKTALQKKINSNIDRISEISINLKTLYDKEKDESDIFSPRNNISNKEEIEALIQEKNILTEDNSKYCEKINELNLILSKLYKFQSKDGVYKVVPKNKKDESHALFFVEADRQRIAKDLHDTSLQNLTAIIHKLELASMFIEKDPIKAKLEIGVAKNSIKETINEIRDTIFELRPMSFDDLGFRTLLESYIKKEIIDSNVNIVFDKFSLQVKDESILIFIYRVLKECIGNSIKHSKCQNINIVIDDSNKEDLFINIDDDGIGFDIEEKNLEKNKHFGLIILRERVKLLQGIIEMTSNKNGTKIHITIPIRNFVND